jgi:hypothetical protein
MLRFIIKYWHQSCSVIFAMRELGTGLLMLMVCGAVYLQTDPTILNVLSQIVVRLIG